MRVVEISLIPNCRRIRLQIEMPNPDIFLTSHVPHLPKYVFDLLPRLSKHTCHNDLGLTFREECRNTEIPHLFEHLIIELQLQARCRPSDFLRGETEWNWTRDPRGCFVVSVDYDNELLAIGAIRLAERMMRAVDERDLSIDMDAEIARLRTLMNLGEDLTGSLPVVSEAARQPRTSRRSAVGPRAMAAENASHFAPEA